MKRTVTGFHLDEEGHWVAALSCGHGQHVRHDPPMVERPWVLTESGRAERLGVELDCVRCDAREMPDGFAPYRRTATFDETTLPAALRARHSTKAGVWARIHVLRGRLRYVIEPPIGTSEVLTPEAPGVVLAEVEHRVEPLGPVELFVEFWRREP